MQGYRVARRGTASGITALGETVCIAQIPASRSYRVWVDGPQAMLDPRTRIFSCLAQARAYAVSLVDPARTGELAWW